MFMSIEPTQNNELDAENQFYLARSWATAYGVKVNNLEVYDSDSEVEAKRIWEEVKEFRKKVDAQRKEKIEPLRKVISSVNDASKEITDPLEQAEDTIKKKITQYRTLLEIQRLEELKAKEEAAKIIGSDQPVYVAPVEKVTRDGGVIAYTKTEKKFRIVEALSVPRQFLTVNEDAIAMAIKQGCTEIPGIEIYEETKTILRSR
jgi:hypothetical protein